MDSTDDRPTLRALENGDPMILFKEGKLAEARHDYPLAQYYYQQAIRQMIEFYDSVTQKINVPLVDQNAALIQRANHCRDVENNVEMMKFYLNKAVTAGSVEAIIHLGDYYRDVEHNYDMMKFYYQQAIAFGSIPAILRLGNYYRDIEINQELMKLYYVKALEYGNVRGMVLVSNLNTVSSYTPAPTPPPLARSRQSSFSE